MATAQEALDHDPNKIGILGKDKEAMALHQAHVGGIAFHVCHEEFDLQALGAAGISNDLGLVSIRTNGDVGQFPAHLGGIVCLPQSVPPRIGSANPGLPLAERPSGRLPHPGSECGEVMPRGATLGHITQGI
jgi:hypothetical protein